MRLALLALAALTLACSAAQPVAESAPRPKPTPIEFEFTDDIPAGRNADDMALVLRANDRKDDETIKVMARTGSFSVIPNGSRYFILGRESVLGYQLLQIKISSGKFASEVFWVYEPFAKKSKVAE